MDSLIGFVKIAVVTVNLNGHEQRYPMRLIEGELNLVAKSRFKAMNPNGIEADNSHNAPKFLGMSNSQLPLLSGSIQHVYSERYIMPVTEEGRFLAIVDEWRSSPPNTFFDDFYKAINGVKIGNQEVRDLLGEDFFESLKEGQNKPSKELSELFTDDFFIQLNSDEGIKNA